MRNSCKFQICARTKYKQSGPPKVSNKQHFSCCDIPILVKKWFSKNEEMISYYSKSFVRQQLAGNHFQQKDCLLCYVYRASQEPLLQSFIQVNIIRDRARSWVNIRKVTFSTKTLRLQGKSRATFTVFHSSEHHPWSRAIMSEHQESDFFNKNVTFTGQVKSHFYSLSFKFDE